MSGVYIRDMQIPKNCYDCPFAASSFMPTRNYSKRYEWCCVLTKKSLTSTKRNRACPLADVSDRCRLIADDGDDGNEM